MSTDVAAVPAPNALRSWVLAAGRRYWPNAADAVASLPVVVSDAPATTRLTAVPLPTWAAGHGVGSDNSLLVDSSCVTTGPGEPWLRVDWWRACFEHLNGTAERSRDPAQRSADSRAGRLRRLDARRWDHAWVNRIMLLLRRWAARHGDREENALFGPLPTAVFDLTHDVDAVENTGFVCLKRVVVGAGHAAGSLFRGRPRPAMGAVGGALRSVRSRSVYWCFDSIMDLEERFGVRSTFHFYAGEAAPAGPRGFRRRLLDPGYDVTSGRFAGVFARLGAGDWTVGLHPAYDSFRDAAQLSIQRQRLETAAGCPVTRCRQHWLRFAWPATWQAQQDAGLRLDATLGFNDRPGFRVAAALRYHPWDEVAGVPMAIEAIPLVLMDSHLYDRPRGDGERLALETARWIDEVKAVGGEASIVWHQRVMHPDYGWAPGYEQLLRLVT